MFDKLKINSQKPFELNKLHNNNWFNSCSKERVLSSEFKNCFILKDKNTHLLTVKTVPVFHSISPLQIELNPTHFNSYTNMLEKLENFAPIESYKITRIDHACDLKISIGELCKLIKVKRKHKRTEFEQSDSINGFNIGNKPEVICIYDKNYQRSKSGLFKRISNEYENVSRIEVRHFKNKVTFPLLTDLKEYLNFNPFNSIEFLDLKDLHELREKDKQKHYHLKEVLKDRSLQSLYKLANQNCNFNRTLGKFFVTGQLNKQILNEYKSNLISFFGGKYE